MRKQSLRWWRLLGSLLMFAGYLTTQVPLAFATTDSLALEAPSSEVQDAGTTTVHSSDGAPDAPSTGSSSERTVRSVRRLRLEAVSVNPITTRHILQNLRTAEADGAALLIELDTPGGLLTSTKEIVKAFLAANVPVIVYVAPNGGSATSAGVFITVAAHIAAMAPSTHIGAATPINLDGSGDRPPDADSETSNNDGSTTPTDQRNQNRRNPGNPSSNNSAAMAKAINDTAAWAEATASTRNRNTTWTRETVTRARSSTAREALQLGVIDMIATTTEDLFRLIDGRVIETANGPVLLETKHLSVPEPIALSTQERFLNFIADPSIALLLISLGTLCLFIEFYNPGLIVPGLIGLISFGLAAVALNILPINTLGVVFIILGIVLILIEFVFPLFFVPTIGGIIFLVVGAMLLIDEPRILTGGFVPVQMALGIGLGTGGILAVIVSMAMKAQLNPVLMGTKSYQGAVAEVSEALAPRGMIFFQGTNWEAVLVDEHGQTVKSDTPLPKGARVRVVELKGLQAKVVEDRSEP
jgi:membrane-bound serine protease (ClpP class)